MYFNIIRVYPKDEDVYSWSSMSSEFLDMDGYDRWLEFRKSNSINETLEVFIRKDIPRLDPNRATSEGPFNDVEQVRFDIHDSIRQQLDVEVESAEAEFARKYKEMPSQYEEYLKEMNTAIEEAHAKADQTFTDYLAENYVTLESEIED
jgi:hypothetical protein